MNIINLSPDALAVVNKLCDQDNMEENIGVLDVAEEQLQKQAFCEMEPVEAYELFTVAYQVKKFKNDLMKLKALLENGQGEGD